MSIEQSVDTPLKYHPVTYAGSPIRFRGPARGLDDPFILCLGGSETFGRFIPDPYAALLDAALPCDVINMGVMNAGLDVLLQDPAIHEASQRAAAVVFQMTGAQNMTNRFYSVHPRRNDRFLKATTMLKTIFPEVDFTEFHFTRHLLTHLQAVSAERFQIVIEELQTAWVGRMQRFLARAPAPVHLLWLSQRAPENRQLEGTLGHDPLFITRPMLTRLEAASLTVCVDTPHTRTTPAEGMFFGQADARAASVMPGPDAHMRAAARLRPLVQQALADHQHPAI